MQEEEEDGWEVSALNALLGGQLPVTDVWKALLDMPSAASQLSNATLVQTLVRRVPALKDLSPALRALDDDQEGGGWDDPSKVRGRRLRSACAGCGSL